MTLQAKIPDLPRPAYETPGGSTLRPRPPVGWSRDTKTGRSPRQCLPVVALFCCAVRSHRFTLTRPLVHATIIAHLNVSLCLMFLFILSAPCCACLLCFSRVSSLSSRPPPAASSSAISVFCPSVLPLAVLVCCSVCPLPSPPLILPAVYVPLPLCLLCSSACQSLTPASSTSSLSASTLAV